MATINKGERSSFNYYRVLRSIWLNKGISQVELYQEHNLDKATVSNIISYLSNKNIIKTIEKVPSGNKPGRRPVGLAINPDFGYITGVELLSKGIRLIAVDMHHNIIVEKFYSKRINYENMEELTLNFIEEFSKINELSGKILVGIGFGFPGIVNHPKGLVHRSFEFGNPKIEYDFKSRVLRNFSIPAFIDNDANCCTWGILSEHRSKIYKNFMFAYLNYRLCIDDGREMGNMGLGIGMAINGNIYFGDSNSAGEYNSIQRKSNAQGQFSIPLEEMTKLKTDKTVQKKFAKELSAQLALFVNTMNFGQLFIGGDVDYLPENIEEVLMKEINKNWPYDEPVQCQIKIIPKKESLVASGAAGMCLERLFSIPDTPEEIQLSAERWDLVFSEYESHSALLKIK